MRLSGGFQLTSKSSDASVRIAVGCLPGDPFSLRARVLEAPLAGKQEDFIDLNHVFHTQVIDFGPNDFGLLEGSVSCCPLRLLDLCAKSSSVHSAACLLLADAWYQYQYQHQ